MKRFIISLFALVAMAMGMQADTVITWDSEFIQTIDISMNYLDGDYISHVENNKKDGITVTCYNVMFQVVFFRNGNISIGDQCEISFKSDIGKIKKIRINASQISESDGTGFLSSGWTIMSNYAEWVGNSTQVTCEYNSTRTDGHLWIGGVTSIVFVIDDGHEEEHVHSYATTWSYDANTHWHACTSTEGYCDTPKADEAAHIFDANKICTVCGYEGYMEYGFSVYSTEVTSQNKNDILGNGVFSYEPASKTLTVHKSYLSPRYGTILKNESVEGLVVSVPEDVTLSALTGFLSYNDMSITGPGHLTVSTQMTTTDMNYGSTLTIKNITIDAECEQWGIAGENREYLIIQNAAINSKAPRGAICDFNGGITLTGCKIIEPVGGYVKDGDVVDASGNLATEVVIAKNGDANLDGVVDIADVVAVLNAMANDQDAPQFNVNGDSAVDIADVVAVLNIMAAQ